VIPPVMYWIDPVYMEMAHTPGGGLRHKQARVDPGQGGGRGGAAGCPKGKKSSPRGIYTPSDTLRFSVAKGVNLF
jgi:hypothetical protein